MPPAGSQDPNFRALFEAIPSPHLVLDTGLFIVAVNDAYNRATMTQRDTMIGHHIFEIFPDNPDDPGADGVANLKASLMTVLATGKGDTMAVQRYDIRRPEEDGGGFEVRYWSPNNQPVFGDDGVLRYICHTVEDVTEFMRMKERDAETAELAARLQTKAGQMEAEIVRRAQEIQATNKLLRRVTSVLDAIIENIPSMIFLKEAKGLTYLRVNRATENSFGHDRKVVLGKTDAELFPPEQAAFMQQHDFAAIAEPHQVHTVDANIPTAGGLRTMHTQLIAIPPADDSNGYVLGISTDITEQAEAERRLRNAKDATEAVNRELEAFCYSIAHDLRAPLRSIDGFSQAVVEDYSEQLDEQGKVYLRYVRDSAQHMARLIDDLLALSRVNRSDFQVDRVDLAALARTTVARLQRNFPERTVEIDISPDLWAEGDVRLLGIALENLIGNAWKFTSKQPKAVIQFGAEMVDGSPVYTVRDNGAGFDMTYAAKLFGVFQRMHKASDFEGTGVGLATVQRIIHRHGGRIWATASPGDGAKFSFTLRSPETGGL